MPKATSQIRHPAPSVIALHEAAEAAIGATTRATPAAVARCRRMLAAALATRATSIAELTYRIETLRETLAREDASTFAFDLASAIALDVAALTTAPAARAA